MRTKTLWSSFLIFAIILLSDQVLCGQQSITSATLGGAVEDTSGASIVGAKVSVTNLEKNQSWNTASNQSGRYLFLFLPPGGYELKIEDPRFVPTTRRLTLQVGQTLEVPVTLSVAGRKQTVNVAGEVPIVELARTQVAETIVPKEMDNLPLNGRNYLDLALLTPGVSRTNTGSNQRFAETSAVPGTGISVSSQRNLNNGFVVDGLSANDDAADLAGTFYSQEVIREFQVVSSGGIAEFGRASSGVINITTQSGTNDWRARLYGYLRNQRFDARNPLATRKDPLTQTQYGATVGGPIRKDLSFLFSNFEQTRQRAAGFMTILPSNVQTINGVLNQAGYAGPRIQTGEFPTSLDTSNFFARVDHALNPANRLTARYSLYDVSSPNSRVVGGLNALSRGTGLQNRDQNWAVSELATLSPRTINEIRGQFTRSRLAAPVNDPVGPAVNIFGVASFGTATFSPTARDIDSYEIADNISTIRGAHSLKAGVNLLYNRVNIRFPGALQGVYAFSSVANLQAARYINFQQAFGAPSQFQSNPNFGIFFQDEWRANPKLTINAGLRYDLQWLPDPISLDPDNLAPRIGIAFTPDHHKTVVRAGFGLYYDRVPLRAVSNALQRDGIKYKVALLSFGQPGAPVFPNVLRSFPAGALTGITTIDPHIQNPYTHQADFQIERELPGKTSLSVGYVHLRGLHIVMSRNLNVPTLSAAEAARLGVPNLGRPNPRFANIQETEGIGDSYYNGMTVSVTKRANRWGSFRVAYTLSKGIDDAGNFFFSTPQDNFNIRDDRGLSDNDQRHRLTLSGWLQTPSSKASSLAGRLTSNFQLSYIFSYGSALPFNIQTGTDRNNDTNINDRPEGVGRNTGRGFDFASLDLRLSRTLHASERFRVETLVEAFNVLNRSNLQLPNNIFGPETTPLPTFGRPNAAADPRQLQFGLRLSF